MNLSEADQMIAACLRAKRQTDVRRGTVLRTKITCALKNLLDEGRASECQRLIKQSEKHNGPHAAHFWGCRNGSGGRRHDGHGLPCDRVFSGGLLGRPQNQVGLCAKWGRWYTPIKLAAMITLCLS